MSDFWKVAGVFIGVIGAAAIIYQLNKGTLAQTASTGFTTAIGDAFASGSSSGSTSKSTNQPNTNTNKTPGTQKFLV